jgi:hypothetical protein
MWLWIARRKRKYPKWISRQSMKKKKSRFRRKKEKNVSTAFESQV